MKIGILTSGGDCPGINATIRGVCKTAINHYGMEVYGIHSGFRGLLDNDITPLTEEDLTGLLNRGGTILGTSRERPFKKRLSSSQNKPALMLKTIQEMQLDALVCIGGKGTQKTAAKLAQMGVNIVSIPKTIDNDVWGTDMSFGFDTAVTIATEAIDRLHSTASAHQRVMVIEVMGHKAGWIALHSGMAGGGDIILIPDLEYNIRNIGNAIIERLKKGKTYSIVVVAEGIKTTDGNFLEDCHKVAELYPEIVTDEWYADIMTAKLIDKKRRRDFKVLLLPNLYGDIISDEAAEFQGGVGTAGCANIGKKYAMFEAIHGSAPRMVNEGRAIYADPCSMLRACVMLLNHIGLTDRGARLERALDICSFEEKKLSITGRPGGATCAEFGNYVMETLSSL